MNLDAVTAELRPRGPWEAADFGARMVNRDARIIYQLWFATTLPLVALASAAIWVFDAPWWAVFVYWWLEPVADGPILHVISRRLFGERTSFRGALRAVPGLAVRNWVFLLTPLRLHFARSVALPIVQLEQLTGARRRARAKVLNQATLNHGIGVTVAYQHLALSIFFGVVLLAFLFIPEAYWDSLGLSWFQQVFNTPGRESALVNFFLFYIAQSALHPWFVGAGFGLYINCRTILEAWDIEVAFRRMLQRRSNLPGAAVAACLLIAAIWSPELPAQDVEIESYWERASVEEAVEAVYKDERLQRYERVQSWRKIDADDTPEPRSTDGLGRFFTMLGRILSIVVEFGLWIVAALLILLVVLTARRWMPYLRPERRHRSERPRVILATGEVTADTLPADVPATVMELWRSGRPRDALSLLYRGSVFAAVDRYGVRLPRSATEGVCVAAVRDQTEQAHAGYFAKIVTAWMWCAYGSRQPADDTIADLCATWPTYYGAVS